MIYRSYKHLHYLVLVVRSIHCLILITAYDSVKFSASAAMDSVRSVTKYQKSLILEEKKICSYAEERLKDYSEYPIKITYEFVKVIKSLPNDYSEKEYIQFIRDWGTV